MSDFLDDIIEFIVETSADVYMFFRRKKKQKEVDADHFNSYVEDTDNT